MAKDNSEAPEIETPAPAKAVLPPGAVMLAKNFGAIYGSRHVFWEAGYVSTDPEEIAFLIRSGAKLES